MNSRLIASCGMNCNLCAAFLREKNSCPGCRQLGPDMPVSIARCTIRTCPILRKNRWRHCSDRCENYPCARLKSLDKRYSTKYGMSMIENLEFIKDKGIRRFLVWEKARWVRGNRIFCVHNKNLYKPLKIPVLRIKYGKTKESGRKQKA